jgi:hypothetical protein
MRNLVAWAAGPVLAFGGVAMCLMAAPGPASAGNNGTTTVATSGEAAGSRSHRTA